LSHLLSQSQEAQNEEYYDHDADDVENVHVCSYGSMCGFNKKWHSNRKRIAMEQSSISRVRSQGSDRTGHRVAKIVMRAGDRAGSGALPGVRPSDNPRTRLFVNADGNIAAVRRCNPRGTRGPVSRKYASPVAALPELLSPDGHGSNNTGLVR
jgi:hypothetical protein